MHACMGNDEIIICHLLVKVSVGVFVMNSTPTKSKLHFFPLFFYSVANSVLVILPPWQEIHRGSESMVLSHQFSSVAQSCPTLCDPMNRSTPGLPVHHQLPEFTQTHVHRVGDTIQPSHPLSSPSPPAPNPSQHQGLFQ